MGKNLNTGLAGSCTIDQITTDVQTLLDTEQVTVEQLVTWCNQVRVVSLELEKLHGLIEAFLPGRSNGQCGGLNVHGRNCLLSTMISIMESSHAFDDGMKRFCDRIIKVTSGKEQLSMEV